MVSRFRRTLSFPKQNPSPSSSPEKSYHVRSISLPCRSHPLISQLKDEINDLRTWESKSGDRTSGWICDGLIRLKNVHDSVQDLLLLPQTQESLRHRSDWGEKLREDFLRFVDVYGIFRATLVTLKEEQLAAQVAMRRRDESKIASYVKARKKMDKEMKKLRLVVQCIVSVGSLLEFDGDAELAGVIRDVNEVTVSVTVALLNGISMSSKSWIRWKLLKKKNKCDEGIREFEEVEVEKLCRLRKKGEEEVRGMLGKLETMENSIEGIERESERVFRSLIKTRVSLLNILTQ